MKTKSPKRGVSARKRPVPPRADAAPKKLLAKIIRIGNSRGIRLPKAVLEQVGFADMIEIAVRGKQLILRPADPRAGWEEAFRRSIEKYGPVEPVDPDWEYMPNEFDEKEWTW